MTTKTRIKHATGYGTKVKSIVEMLRDEDNSIAFIAYDQGVSEETVLNIARKYGLAR